ncbi:MAG: RsmD family RNA methyltransferase [Treponemataceae bacterium]|nr:MAG: RsmD family RNA methyltransferase [Treponemataceae bacterium]
MIVTAEKITAGGDCIARLDGKIVFIPDSLPGETLDIELVEQKHDYARAKIIRILEPSPRRIEPRCAFYGVCGGCNLQIADYEYQLALKQRIAEDTFGRAGCAVPLITVISGSPWAYRSRMQMHTCGSRTGFMARNSHEIIPVNDCPILIPRLNEALHAMRNGVDAFAGARQFSRRENLCAGYIQDGGLYKEIIASENTAECFAPILGERVYFNPRGFFQSNIPLFEKLIQSLCASLNSADGNSALDLYSGCGVFAYFLRKKFSRVVLVEENKEAAESAWKNVPGAEIYAMSAKQWLGADAARREYGAVTADPPRKGLEKEVLEWLCTARTLGRLRYVSCNPATLARDSARLVSSGWTLRSLELYDFYPQTSHIEMLAVFQKIREQEKR